jgi:hypothetical protein
MAVADPRIETLRHQVRAANEEFSFAMQCHEAWKPAAYDTDLHQRLSHSYAGQTFLVVRHVLRSEMLLALTRMWDTNKEGLRMSLVAELLRDPAIINALAAEPGAQGNAPPNVMDEIARERGKLLRVRAAEARKIILNYNEGGSGHSTLLKLKKLRHERLAHRQIKNVPIEVPGQNATDEEIELLYQDMAKLMGLLLGCVERTAYVAMEAADTYRFYSEFFWAGVRSERVEGHPKFRSRSS